MLPANVLTAITAAARLALEGTPVSLSSSAFWGRQGIYGTAERQDVLSRAAAVASMSTQYGFAPSDELLTHLAVGTRYSFSGGSGGPAETPVATWYASVQYVELGVLKWATISGSVAWLSTVADLSNSIANAIAGLSGKYGVEEEEFSVGQIILY
jgi:hypothetical protein